MSTNPNEITYIGETDYRNKKTRFGIKAADRTRHMYVIGKSGMGKSTLLENMAVQDIQNGNGLAFLDPHGGSAEKLLEYVPEERRKDVIYFAPFDMEYPIAFNVMEDVGYDKRHLVVSGLMSAFEKIWADAWSARMSYILQNTLFALLEYPDSTILDINRMLTDKDFRKKVVDNVKDSTVKSYWIDEFAKYSEQYAKDATPAIQNKVGQFASSPLIRNIIGQPKSSFDVREVMDQKKILIMNLSKGRMGDMNTRLLGSMLITKIYLSAMSRADLSHPELAQKPNFYFYVDEFQSFANKSFAEILSEARKYKLNLTIAHQYIEQMEEEVRSAVFGNVGTMVVFRVGSYDAEVFEKEFAPEFTAEDIVNLGSTQVYLRLMIDGVGSKPFSAKTLPPIAVPEDSHMDKVIEMSRAQFAVPRAEIEQRITERQLPAGAGKKEAPGDKGDKEPKMSPLEKKLDDLRKGKITALQVSNKRPPTASTAPRAATKPVQKQGKEPPLTSAAPQKASAAPSVHKMQRGAPENELAAKEHQPFKQAFKTATTATHPHHIHALNKVPLSSKNPYHPSLSENKAALRSALAEVLKENRPAENQSSRAHTRAPHIPPKEQREKSRSFSPAKQPPYQNTRENKNRDERAASASQVPTQTKEIPEHILKKVLE